MSATTLQADAGLSLVELLVSLVILATLATVIGAAVQARPFAGSSTYERLTQLIADARIQSLISGNAQVLVATAISLKVGGRELAWDRSEGVLGLSSNASIEGYRAIVFPDGSLSGPPLRFVTHDGPRRLPGVSRNAASGAE